MPYIAQLIQAQPYTITVTGETKVAVTVFNIRKDRISEVESLVLDPTVNPGNTATTPSRTVASNIGRLLISVSLEGGMGSVTITQVGQTIPSTPCNPDATVVLDVV